MSKKKLGHFMNEKRKKKKRGREKKKVRQAQSDIELYSNKKKAALISIKEENGASLIGNRDFAPNPFSPSKCRN